MFIIIGGDGKEYGPVSADQIRAWITDGRANLDTRAKPVGTENWSRVGDLPDFATPPPLLSANSANDGRFTTAHSDTPTSAPHDEPLAGHGARLGAALIDGMLTSLAWMPTAIPFSKFVSEKMSNGQFNLANFVTLSSEITAVYDNLWKNSLPTLAVLMITQAILLSLRGQSIGKLLLGLRIVRTDGARATFARAFALRGLLTWLLEQIPLLGGLFKLVDICFIFRDDRRCLHDLIADTKVIKPSGRADTR